jgi:hypothetical protein
MVVKANRRQMELSGRFRHSWSAQITNDPTIYRAHHAGEWDSMIETHARKGIEALH